MIYFDLWKTGHTLRLLNFPTIMEKGLEKALVLKEKFGGLLTQLSGMFGQDNDLFDSIFSKLEKNKK